MGHKLFLQLFLIDFWLVTTQAFVVPPPWSQNPVKFSGGKSYESGDIDF